MPEEIERFRHLLLHGHVEEQRFTPQGRGGFKSREVERESHGRHLSGQVQTALEIQDDARDSFDIDELRSLGVILTIESAQGFLLKLESLDRLSRHRRVPKRPMWLLLSVTPAKDELPEQAHVWVSDDYRQAFLNLFEAFISEDHGLSGRPKNRLLIANIDRIRATALRDLWQSDGEPPDHGVYWWEIWLRASEDAVDLARRFAAVAQLSIADRCLRLDNRHVVWIEARWDDLVPLPASAVPIAEIRRPQFVDTIQDLDREAQGEYADDLASRVSASLPHAPAVCLLDTGARRSHVLLENSLSHSDMHTVVGGPLGDQHGHGTLMAGLALFGPLDQLLTSNDPVDLIHRLESVKFIPDQGDGHEPESYGIVTAEAIVLPEIESGRRRTYCLTVTGRPERAGEPSLWSAAVDALAMGTGVGRSDTGIDLIGLPDPDARRLVVVSTGNVEGPYMVDYLSKCDLSPVEDPAQAWNALVVGAHTELCNTPSDFSYEGWEPVAVSGDISPHSRTGLIAGGTKWPNRPDICMEGGNVLADGRGDFDSRHPTVSLSTTASKSDGAIGSANATSAATAQASRLAARAMAVYPEFWAETIRGLMTHAAEWTPHMRRLIDQEQSKTGRRNMLRRYGWGVPNAQMVESSARNAVTMVTQDEFVPFTGKEYSMRQFRLHTLPWPSEVLSQIGEEDVELRVTLTYFIEPSGSRRGWRHRYAYASHGLRFELQRPNEPVTDFVQRAGRLATAEESGRGVASRPINWLVGPNQRNSGSLHQDIWLGHGAELATTGAIAVYPVGGWWKNNGRKDRQDLPVRYALLVSLRTPAEEIDLYTPIAVQAGVPVEAVAVEV